MFYDPREAIKVYNHLRIKPARLQGEAEEAILHCRPISVTEVRSVSPLLSALCAGLKELGDTRLPECRTGA